MATILILSTAHAEGTGAYVMLSEYLRAQRASLHTIKVLCPPEGRVADAAKESNLGVIPLLTQRDSLIGNLIAMQSCMPKLKDVDLVLAWHTRSFELAWYLSRRLNIPSAGVIHDHPETPIHSCNRKRIAIFAAKRLHRLIGVSEAVTRVWKDRIGGSMISCIHNGLNDIPISTHLREKMLVSVGFLGGSAVTKGFPLVRDWIQKSEMEPVHWKLFGEYADSDRLSLDGKAEFMGSCEPEDIYPQIDVLVHASPFFDPYPTVLLEAARSGLPVIASFQGGSAEIVDQGLTGYLFNPDAEQEGFHYLMGLVQDRQRAQEMGVQARIKFENEFRIENMVSQYDQFYDFLLKKIETE